MTAKSILLCCSWTIKGPGLKSVICGSRRAFSAKIQQHMSGIKMMYLSFMLRIAGNVMLHKPMIAL